MQSRETKFRVWDKVNKYLLKPDFFGYLAYTLRMDGRISASTPARTYPVDNDNLEVQFYTGLKDKNGKEIYEGDLVNFYTPGHPHGPEREDYKSREVWYDSDSAAFVFDKLYYDVWHGYSAYDIKDIEVVGNIFETPPIEN